MYLSNFSTLVTYACYRSGSQTGELLAKWAGDKCVNCGLEEKVASLGWGCSSSVRVIVNSCVYVFKYLGFCGSISAVELMVSVAPYIPGCVP